MHRELRLGDSAFHDESPLSLYFLTGLIGLLLGADLWPIVALWANASYSLGLPTWPNEWAGYRLALVPAVLGGARILFGSIEALLESRLGADLAVAIACVASIMLNEPVVAAEVVFIALAGECLESFTFARTQGALRGLVELCPRRCWRLREGQEERILVTELRVGDHVLVKPGGRVPADGIVRDGRSALDVSALTGEAMPADKQTGDEVLAGSLNQFGALTIEATRVAEQTVLGRVVELTARALRDKAPIERTADRLARWFLPAVLAIAALTFLTVFAVQLLGVGRSGDAVRATWSTAARLATVPALSVLVVACPCALILATPAALVAALGRLAGTGVLIKGTAGLERLASVDTFAFDKTGTLTEGRMEIGAIVPLADHSADDVLRIAAAVETSSEHPLARVIVAEARRLGLPLDAVADFVAFPGGGVRGRSSDVEILVGSARLLRQHGVALSDEAEAKLRGFDAQGQTMLLVAQAGIVLGAIGVRDRLRPSGPGIVARLHQLGIEHIALLTGDRAAVAEAIGRAASITDIHAELLPTDKADWIARQQEQGRRVAMVGDGVNDAPALARATVGIAVGSATDIAGEAGDIVLLHGEGDPLGTLPLLLRLARATVAIIRQNIFVFAFGINAVGILLTAWLWPLLAPASWYEQGPVAAVIYHQIGSLAVLLNSMRLLWFERHNVGAQRLSSFLERIGSWIEAIDVDGGLHWLMHHWRRASLACALVLILALALSGFVQVGPDEIAIVRRCGRPLDADLEPGIHWCLPWPIDEVTRFQPARIRTLEIGFRSLTTATSRDARDWSSAHTAEGLVRRPEESVMMTGDGNLLELQATLRYTVPQPRVFLFDVADAPSVLHDATEAVLREITASRSFADLLTVQREQLSIEALERLQPWQSVLGVRLDGLSIHDLHPPQPVVAAYHEVTQAMEARDRRVNEAEAATLQSERAQQAESVKLVRQAESARLEKVRLAEARRDEFFALCVARNGSPGTSAARAMLTDFQLYWQTLGNALAGRDKVIIDADKVPGRRHLWLAPFDPPRLPSEQRNANPNGKDR